MSSSKRWTFKNVFTSEGGCGCGKPKLEEILEPKPKAKAAAANAVASSDQKGPPSFCPSSSSSWERGGGHSIDDDYTSTALSLNIGTSPHSSEKENDSYCTKMVSPCTKLGDSVAVVKDSLDPYQDFRQSMLQMILEKEIYSEDELQELLNCFLHLNSPSNHKIIVQAFMEIWNGVVSKRPVLEKPSPHQADR